MRVLFVFYHFPPMASVATTRATRMLEGLVRQGIEPVVLTPGSSAGRSWETVGEVSVDVVRFEGADPLASMHRQRVEVEQKRAPLLLRAKKLVRSLWLPDERRSLIRPWIAAGRELRAERFDCVYSSMSPATTGFVGRALAEALGKPWILELRDLWAKNPYLPQTTQPLSAWLTGRWEREHMAAASRVVVLTDAHKKHLAKLYPGFATKLHVFPSMFRPLTLERKPRPADVLRIFYGGTLYADRTLAPLGKAMDSLGHAGQFSRIQLEVAGRSQSAPWSEVLGGRGENRVLHGYLPQARVEELLQEVHAGILNNPARDRIHIPGKFYDYLAAGLPVIDLSSQPDIQTIGEGAIPVWQCPSRDPEELRRILEELSGWWAENPQGAAPPGADHPLSLQRVTEAMLKMFREL